MKIIVCVKQVPDSAAAITIENGSAIWPDSPMVVNPWDEFAIEASLIQKEQHGGEVIALSLGSEDSKAVLRSALAMGCSEAALVLQPDPQNFDGLVTARILAAAIQKIGGADLVVMGRQAIDTDLGTTPAQVGRILGWPVLSLISSIQSIDLDSRLIQIERACENGRQVLESSLPAVISVVKDIGKPRYPSFMNIRKAQTMPIQSWLVADLGIAQVKSTIHCIEQVEPPRRSISTEMISGETSQEIAESLLDKLLGEKVL